MAERAIGGHGALSSGMHPDPMSKMEKRYSDYAQLYAARCI